MKFVSWNVNGLRAVMQKGFDAFIKETSPDFLALQETKMQEHQKEFAFAGYHEYWYSAERKGYSGTLVYAKQEPLSVIRGLQRGDHPEEGRVIALEYPDFYFVDTYSPNSQEELARLDYRMAFENDFREFLKELDGRKPVILCGDLNVAHEEIDIKNPKQNARNAGFTIEERTKFTELLESGFTDSFRYTHPDVVKYSWWSYRFNARQNNAGWRIDYFVVSDRIRNKIKKAEIWNDVFGSDHCPVMLEIDI